MKNMEKTNSGQIALVVLIISAIVMTLGLSVAKKSVVETKITTDEELLKQAFNAAESGIDYYLQTTTPTYSNPDGISQANITVNEIGGGRNEVNLGVITLENDLSYTWLIGHKLDGAIDFENPLNRYDGDSLTLCVDNDFKGALKVDYFYKNGDDYGVKRLGFNVNSPTLVNEYSSINLPDGGCIPLSGLPIVTTPLLLVVKPIGDSANISVKGSTGFNFPNQAQEISSLGTAGDVNTGVNRNVKVINQYQIPAFLLDAVTASGSVLSN